MYLLIAALATSIASATTIIVTNNADSGPGTLRRALADATDGDAVYLDFFGTIKLTSGELLVSKNVTIAGPGGPPKISIDANANSRVFHISSNAVVLIFSLRITNGRAADDGGGILNDHGHLMLDNCVVTGNSSPNGAGGGIFNNGANAGSATLVVINSSLSRNSAGLTNYVSGGGAIYSIGCCGGIARVELVASTLNGNSSYSSGGALFNDHGTIAITNSTISGNSSELYGGAIFNRGGFDGTADVKILNSTLADNHGDFYGSTIFNDSVRGGSATLEVGSSILDVGTGTLEVYNYGGITMSFGFNLITDDRGHSFTNSTDIVNTNALLGPLQSIGGSTFTQPLLCGSPAIDTGKNFSSSPTDQRGFPRTFDNSNFSNTSGGDGTDIGAFEAQQGLCIPWFTRLTRQSNNVVQLHLAGEPGNSYGIEASQDLKKWETLGYVGNGSFTFDDNQSTNLSHRFYKPRRITP